MSNHTMNGDPMDDWRFGFEVKSAQIGAAEVGAGVTYTIDRVDFRNIGDGQDAKMRPVIKVKESDLDWVTCKTTLFCVEAMFGRSPREWLGKQITLYWDPTVKFGRETVGGVRVAGAPGIRNMTVKIKLPKKRDQEIRLVDTAPQNQAPPLGTVIKGAGATREHLDAWLASKGKPTTETISEADADKLRDVLIGPKGAGMLAEIKAMDLTPPAAEGNDGAADFAGDEPGARGEF